MNHQIKTDKFHRAIDCPTCKAENDPTQLQAWITPDGLTRLDKASIEAVEDEDIHNPTYDDVGVELNCEPCNGVDDGDDGNQD